jgi:hypothetical protein
MEDWDSKKVPRSVWLFVGQVSGNGLDQPRRFLGLLAAVGLAAAMKK